MVSLLMSIALAMLPEMSNEVEIEIRVRYGIDSVEQAQRLAMIADKNLENIQWHWNQDRRANWFQSWQSATLKQIVFTQLRWALDRRWGIEKQQEHLSNIKNLLCDGPLPSPYVGD